MTNNETTFFRDPRVFGMLRNAILPALVAARSRRAVAEHLVRGLLDRSGTLQRGDARCAITFRRSTGGTSVSSRATCPEGRCCARASGQLHPVRSQPRPAGAPAGEGNFKQQRAAWEIEPAIRRMVGFPGDQPDSALAGTAAAWT